MKQLILCCLVCLCAQNLSAQILESIRQEQAIYDSLALEEKVYVQTDRTLYAPGETIWFHVFVTNLENAPSTHSEQVYAELYGPNGAIVDQLMLRNEGGQASGQFQLGSNVVGGLYQLRVYSYWMQNFGAGTYFEKELRVQKVVLPEVLMQLDFEREAYGAGDQVMANFKARTKKNEPLANKKLIYTVQLDGAIIYTKTATTNEEGKALLTYELPKKLATNKNLINVRFEEDGLTESIARSAPIVLNNLDVQLLPEGGTLVANQMNRIAVKVLNEFGQAADIEGEIINKAGKVIGNFKSFHQGMGAFELRPEKNESYRFRVTNPVGIRQTWKLPEVEVDKLGIYVKEQGAESLTFELYSPSAQTVFVLAKQQGNLMYSEKIAAQEGANTVTFSTKDFPMGIVQLTVLDAQEQVHAERLVFVNYQRKLSVQITSNKANYLPREKVDLEILVEDETGRGVQGNFSMAVVDDKQHTFADDKQDNILSYLLMSSDLKGSVYEPNFYFDPKNEKAKEALDYVLLTHGWRRFDLPTMDYPIEQKAIFGYLKIGAQLGKNQTIFLSEGQARYTKKKALAVAQTDENGFFKFEGIAVNFPAFLSTSYRGEYQSIQINQYSDPTISLEEVSAVIELDQNTRQGYYKKEEEDKLYDVPNQEIVFDSAFVNPVALNRAEFSENEYTAIIEEPSIVEILALPERNISSIRSTTYGISYNPSSIEQMNNGMNNRYNVRDMRVDGLVKTQNLNLQQIAPQSLQYKVIPKFYQPNYSNNTQVDVRSDFRKTIYWNPEIQTDKKGKATVSYYNSDEVTTFRAILEGNSATGQLAHQEHTYSSSLPFSIITKIPSVLSFGDTVKMPIVLKNNSPQMLTGVLTIDLPKFLKVLELPSGTFRIPADTQQVVYLSYQVGFEVGKGAINIGFKAEGFKDFITQKIQTSAKGFPVGFVMAGQYLEQTDTFMLQEIYEGSLTSKLKFYPTILEGLMEGVESILRSPSGCFEQVSSSNYPNILALQLMEETGKLEANTRQKALAYLETGYQKLAAYEIKGGGFEWYGQAPAHEGLTAYGLVQFKDMQAVYNGVESSIIKRTQDYLLSRRDGEGGFLQNVGKYGFSGNKPALFNAYITWALSEVNTKGIQKEVEAMTKEAIASEDLYRMSLAALTHFNLGNEERAENLLKSIQKMIQKVGLENVRAESTVTYSSGNALNIETLSFAALAMMESEQRKEDLIIKIVEYLLSKRQYGRFGSTQSTVMALKVLSTYTKSVIKQEEDKSIKVQINGATVWEMASTKGRQGSLTIDSLHQYFVEGQNIISIKFEASTQGLPYSFDVAWTSKMPQSSVECPLRLTTSFNKKQAKMGETVRLEIAVQNTKTTALPSTMALIGIPAGLSVQAWQLKDLQEKQEFAFYELKDNYLILYYRELDGQATKRLSLDLKTEVPGHYTAPANSTYLYYGEEYKYWSAGAKVQIN